jgi:hypothetical protein
MVSAQQLKYFRMPWKKSFLTCQDVEIYDIIVYGRNQKENDINLRGVLEMFKQ